MTAGAPALHDTGMKNGMAVKAFLGGLTNRGFLAPSGASHQRPRDSRHHNPTLHQGGLLFVRGG
jgi:phage tail tape-measure protein